MPKVKEEYLNDRRKQILDATYRICMQKPVYSVTMRDIISEMGWSQGAIYRYFKTIHEIMYQLINRQTAHYDIKKRTDAILELPYSPEQIIAEIFNMLTQTTMMNIRGIGKIVFEYTVLVANQPEYCVPLIENVKLSQDMIYLREKLIEYLLRQTSNNYFKPQAPIRDLYTSLSASLDGIERNLVLMQCYELGPHADTLPNEIDPQKLMDLLYTSFIFLLGGNPDKRNAE